MSRDLVERGIVPTVERQEEVTSLAVFEEAVGERVAPADAGKLSADQLEHASEALEQFFAAWSRPPSDEAELRVSVGEQYLRKGRERLLGDLCLYAHTVVVRDPLERWLGERQGGEATASVQDLAAELRALDQIRPLIDSGIVLPAPYLGRDRWIEAPDDPDEQWELAKEAASNPEFALAVLGELPTRAEYWPLVALEEDPHDPDRDLSLIDDLPDLQSDARLAESHLAVVVEGLQKVERLLHATDAGAIFAPLSEKDRAFVNAGLPGLTGSAVDAEAEIEAEVISTLSEIRVPILDDLSPENLVAARQKAGAFEEWRSHLAEVLISTAGNTSNDMDKMRVLVNGELERTAAEVRREVSMSGALQKAARDSTSQVMMSAILWGGIAAATGADPRRSLLGAGVGGLARILAAPLMRKSPSGYRGVLLQLVR